MIDKARKTGSVLTSTLLLTCAGGRAQAGEAVVPENLPASLKQAATVESASLPAIPRNRNGFRAYYTRLNYTPDWEKPWRAGRFADVVVCFPNSDISFVFWRGAGYIPNWVTDNGIWYNNQFVERSSGGSRKPKAVWSR